MRYGTVQYCCYQLLLPYYARQCETEESPTLAGNGLNLTLVLLKADALRFRVLQ
jgi:hypothetical protein